MHDIRSGKSLGHAEDAMLTLLTLGALDATESDPDGVLVPDPDHPGYLRRQIADRTVFIPFHLAKVSPAADLMAEVIEIGAMVQLVASNPICISGSTTFLGALNVIADLDYCEYFVCTDIDTESALDAASQIEDLPLVWAKFADAHHCAPWTCLRPIAQAFRDEPARLKLDFMSCGKLGPMPTTNVILPTSDGEDGAADQSFAFQEAVVCGEAPLRSLIKPARFGDYLLFLKDQARHYVNEGDKKASFAIKALKRLLALKAALGDHTEVDAIVERLNRPEIEEVVQRIRLDELLAMRPHLPKGVPARFTEQIQELELKPSHASSRDVEDALSAARKLAAVLLEEAERDFAEYA